MVATRLYAATAAAAAVRWSWFSLQDDHQISLQSIAAWGTTKQCMVGVANCLFMSMTRYACDIIDTLEGIPAMCLILYCRATNDLFSLGAWWIILENWRSFQV